MTVIRGDSARALVARNRHATASAPPQPAGPERRTGELRLDIDIDIDIDIDAGAATAVEAGRCGDYRTVGERGSATVVGAEFDLPPRRHGLLVAAPEPDDDWT